jgi:hypothetical protein
MRKRYIQNPDPPYELIPEDEYHRPAQAGFFVVPDIQPYQSMVTGEVIGGRRQHREHLRQHNVVEVGNELDKATPKPWEPPKGLKEHVIRAAHQHFR